MVIKNFDRFMTCLAGGGILTMINFIFGEIDYSLTMLLIAMITDFATGLLCGANEHSISSRIAINGLFRKLMILIYVMLAHHLDVLLDVNYIRTAVCYMYIVSEIISIIENGAKLGVPIPEPIKKALELMNNHKED